MLGLPLPSVLKNQSITIGPRVFKQYDAQSLVFTIYGPILPKDIDNKYSKRTPTRHACTQNEMEKKANGYNV